MCIRDSDKPEPLSWSLERQGLPWATEDGEPMASCVLLPADVQEEGKAGSLGGKQRKAFDCLQALVNRFRENLTASGHSPDGARVSIKDWDEAMKEFEGDSGNRSRERKTLQSRKLVIISDGYVQIA